MSRYLSALKISESGGATNLKNLKNPRDEIQKRGDDQPKKPLLVGSLGLLGTSPTPFEIIQAANDTEQAVDNLACFTWLIHFTDREPVTVTFSPEVNHAGALACYPDAVAAEPENREITDRAPNDGSAELRRLVAAIYQRDTDDERSDALNAALADPDNALACYTSIASERGLTLPNTDDSHTCRQCASYTYSGMCSVATPGGQVSAQRGYRPGAMFQEEPHRCVAFNERII